MLSVVRLGGAVCATVAALASGVAVATAPASTASCGPPEARTLASSSQARVYALKGADYGCAGKRQFRLGRWKSPCAPCVDRVVVAGTLAAYVLDYPGYDNSTSDVLVRRLTDGKRLSWYRASTATGETFQAVTSLVVSPDGGVAWISAASGIGISGRQIEVHRGKSILDHGRTIAPHSLKLHGTVISWRHGSKTRTASLH